MLTKSRSSPMSALPYAKIPLKNTFLSQFLLRSIQVLSCMLYPPTWLYFLLIPSFSTCIRNFFAKLLTMASALCCPPLLLLKKTGIL